MIYGYARVSTDGQSVDAQVAALTAAGAGRVFREVASGAKRRWCTDAGEPTVLVPPGPWCQGARMETGFATRIMRLSTSVAMAVSPCWAGKMRARILGPMIAL